MSRKAELLAERKSLLSKSESIVETVKAAGRDLSLSEASEVEQHLDRIKAIDTEVADISVKAAASADLIARLQSGHVPEELEPPSGVVAKGRGAWAKSVAGALRTAGQGMGVKALLTGEIATPPAVEVVALPAKPTRLLELVQRRPITENTFSYLRETVATNNATVVADGATKPTSVYTFEEIEDRARVVAHLSEPFPIRYASDHASMVQVLDGQMQAGVYEAIERLIVNGTGTGEEWAGILTTTGTTAVAFATDAVTTLRKARTTLELLGERITAVAMNPADIEALDLIRENGTTGGFLLDSNAYERLFGPGVQGVPSLAVPAGTAILGDWSVVELKVREDVQSLAATQAGDLFDKNQMKLRTEGRYGFKFSRPQALAVVDLTA